MRLRACRARRAFDRRLGRQRPSHGVAVLVVTIIAASRKVLQQREADTRTAVRERDRDARAGLRVVVYARVTVSWKARRALVERFEARVDRTVRGELFREVAEVYG